MYGLGIAQTQPPQRYSDSADLQICNFFHSHRHVHSRYITFTASYSQASQYHCS